MSVAVPVGARGVFVGPSPCWELVDGEGAELLDYVRHFALRTEAEHAAGTAGGEARRCLAPCVVVACLGCGRAPADPDDGVPVAHYGDLVEACEAAEHAGWAVGADGYTCPDCSGQGRGGGR